MELEFEPVRKISRTIVNRGSTCHLGHEGVDYLGEDYGRERGWVPFWKHTICNEAKQMYNPLFVGAQE